MRDRNGPTLLRVSPCPSCKVIAPSCRYWTFVIPLTVSEHRIVLHCKAGRTTYLLHRTYPAHAVSAKVVLPFRMIPPEFRIREMHDTIVFVCGSWIPAFIYQYAGTGRIKEVCTRPSILNSSFSTHEPESHHYAQVRSDKRL